MAKAYAGPNPVQVENNLRFSWDNRDHFCRKNHNVMHSTEENVILVP